MDISDDYGYELVHGTLLVVRKRGACGGVPDELVHDLEKMGHPIPKRRTTVGFPGSYHIYLLVVT